MIMKNLKMLIEQTCKSIDFSGVVSIQKGQEVLFQSAYGLSNRSDKINNKMDTRFGIASGCKIFTAVAISQLVEKGVLSFETRLKDCLPITFSNFDENITVHQLLTHTSGIPDYFDEAVMDDFADLWKERPMYTIERLHDFLPMFQHNEMMFTPGEKFHYNNAGYILLGLIVEQQSGLPFTEYVEKNIFVRCSMEGSGYFELHSLPAQTALGYIDNEDGTWKTNIYSIPVKGGSDGGAFITAADMVKFWQSLLRFQLLSEQLTNMLLAPHVVVEEDDCYGYGVWVAKKKNEIFKYHVMGYDPGVSFHSAFYPSNELTVVIPSNKSEGAYDVMKTIENALTS
ncbi:serine hydrolase [Sutcliffiella sp. NC1]|nr:MULTISPECIES: serine hydrolase [Sutcliffiella]MED4015079.1 serine hydrolase [Sutcliffiella cohnii]WBL17196.1 serine hydrolase [Sutcliffiella sp. NC1]